MVYTGKPSTGCSACRERKIRCDQIEPSCSQCLRREQICPGYRNPANTMFRDETWRTVSASHLISSAARSRSSHRKGPTTPYSTKTSEDAVPDLMRAYLAVKDSLVGDSLGGMPLEQYQYDFPDQGIRSPVDLKRDRGVLIHYLTCRALSIGKWTRIGQNTMDLLIFYAPDKCTLTYYISNGQAEYKIEYPFSHIKNIFLEDNGGDPTKHGGIVIELNEPPNFFSSPTSNGFFQCGDFTKDIQATQCLVHHLGGNPKILSGQLAELVSLPSFMSRHNGNPYSQAEPYPTSPATFGRVRKTQQPPMGETTTNDTEQLAKANERLFLLKKKEFSFPPVASPLLLADAFTEAELSPAEETLMELLDVEAEAGSIDGDFESRLTDLRIEQESALPSGRPVADNSKQSEQRDGTEFRCETCGYFPRGNPKYFKQSLAKHMKRHAVKESRSSFHEAGDRSETVVYEGEVTSDLSQLTEVDLDESLTGTKSGFDGFDKLDSPGPQEFARDFKDEGAFTDSGYASAPNLNGYLSIKSPTRKTGSPGPNCTDNDDTATLYSAGTTVAPARAQTYISEICNDIYSKLNDCVNAKTWPVVSKILPDLIKAFAVRLGNDCAVQVNRDIMCFVHQRHREVVSQLEAMFSHDTEEPLENCRPTLQGMPLLDKMSMWRSRDGEDATPAADGDDYFHGVNDDEDQDDHIENIDLSAYQKVIFDSQAYKWFLATCKKEVTLQREVTTSSSSCTRTNESIRRSLREKLPTGTISKRYAPSRHEMTFVLGGHLRIALCLERETVEPASRPSRSFPDLVVTGSVNQAQALTIKQYMCQTWPANGLQMLQALEEGMQNPKNLESGKSPANAPLVVGRFGSNLIVKASGPAYFIAECGEQLAWLESASSTVARNGLCRVTPLIDNIRVGPTTPQSSSYRGMCRRADHICLWHPYGPTTETCFCDKGTTVVDHANLDSDRHIIGTCEPPESLGGADDAHSINTGTPSCIGSLNASRSKRQAVTASDETELDTSSLGGLSREVTREPLRRSQPRVSTLKEHASATPMTVLGSPGGSQSVTATESGDDSFDTDQLSISDSSETERLDVNDPQYLVLKRVLFRLLSGYRTRQQCPSTGESGQGPCASTIVPNLSNSNTTGASNQTNLKRKRGNDYSDDADQDGFQRPPQKKTNRDAAEASKKSFACPFLKKDPIEHRDCCTRKLSRIRDVKQHLARRHTPERYCQLCFETSFATERSLRDHIKERSCSSQDPSTLKGISYDQHRQLSKKSNPALGEEGQWFAIWDVIFPESPDKPVSAYIDTGLSVEMRLFREYSYSFGPAMLREQIMSNPNCMRQDSTEEDQQRSLDRVIAEGITHLFETWRSAQSTGATLSSNQRSNNPHPGQATPLSSIADSGFATESHMSSLENGSQVEGSGSHVSMMNITCPPPATMTAAESQTSIPSYDMMMESSDIHDPQNLFGLFANMDNMGDFNANGNEIGFDTFDQLQGNFGGFE
ncbi:homeobox protein hoy1 [Ilyonectria robusta]